MGRGRTQQGTPDLFSTASPPGETSSPPATKQVSSAGDRPYVLPKDLLNTVKHLNDRELDMLITASLEEARRRGRLPPTVHLSASDESVSKQSPRMRTSSHQKQVEVATISLRRGQINAVLAALKAGVKPPLIARQFGISQSDVRKALASDTSVRGAR